MTVLIVASLALLMLGIERMRPGRRWPTVPGWWPRALALNAVQVGIVVFAGSTWDGWMAAHRLWSIEAWPFALRVAAGYLAITFIYYGWHRARHESPLLWRWFHQVHHSPARLEVATSFYKHPFEIAVNGVLSSGILFLLVGLDAAAAGVVVLLTGVAELFYHWNVKTPYWLGFLIQRPESHCVHHQRGRHHSNYSDLPIWDWLFGTLDNPRHFDAACGFSPEPDTEGPLPEQRLGALLLGRDLSRLAPAQAESGSSS